MSSDSAHYVSHASCSRDQLNGKQLALCKNGTPLRCTINAGPPRAEDKKYVVTLTFGLSLVPAAPGEGPGALGQEPLDQATVDRIEAVEKGSPLSRMRFDFALMQDAISNALAKDDTPKLNLKAPPPIPLSPL